MAVEAIDDRNYERFRHSNPAVLVISLKGCPACTRYAPEIEAVSNSRSLWGVKFGNVVVGGEQSIDLVKKEFGELNASFPTTMVLRQGHDPFFFSGVYLFDDALEIIAEIFKSGDREPESEIAIIHRFRPGYSTIDYLLEKSARENRRNLFDRYERNRTRR